MKLNNTTKNMQLFVQFDVVYKWFQNTVSWINYKLEDLVSLVTYELISVPTSNIISDDENVLWNLNWINLGYQ